MHYLRHMGRASRRKGEAHAVRRDRPRLLASLAEAREFLSASSNSYDHGFEAEAKRIAVSLRMLLHDTSASHSVLEQLRVKRAIHWVDTADPINPRNLIPLASWASDYAKPLDWREGHRHLCSTPW